MRWNLVRRIVVWAALAVFFSPLLLVYLGWEIGRLSTNLLERTRWGLRLIGQTIDCPSCGEENALAGRWTCRAPGCGATYHGFVGRCRLCGAGASWFPCARCQVSILLGPRR